MKPTATFLTFDALDIRIGTVVAVDEARTKKPTYRLTIDFGPEIGTRRSCGAYRNYARDFLVGKQVVCVVNFEAKRMGPEVSEVLMLGVPNPQGETIFLTPQQNVNPGVAVF